MAVHVQPLLLRRGTGRGRAKEVGEMNAVGLGDVAAEGEHGHAAVLDLCLPEEAPGRRVALAPEIRIREAERIEVANGRVQRRRKLLFGLHRHGRVARGSDMGQRRRGEGQGSGLNCKHGFLWNARDAKRQMHD